MEKKDIVIVTKHINADTCLHDVILGRGHKLPAHKEWCCCLIDESDINFFLAGFTLVTLTQGVAFKTDHSYICYLLINANNIMI